MADTAVFPLAQHMDSMPLLAHLEELRKRIIFSILGVLVGFLSCWSFADDDYDRGIHETVSNDHFGLWHDKAGNAVSQPLAGVTDPETGLTFPDLNARHSELDQTNLILPEPCGFISKSLPQCSVIRPTSTENGGAVATITSFTADLLLHGQSQAFFTLVNRLAVDADSVRRGF
jgi:hypothetical protein